MCVINSELCVCAYVWEVGEGGWFVHLCGWLSFWNMNVPYLAL